MIDGPDLPFNVSDAIGLVHEDELYLVGGVRESLEDENIVLRLNQDEPGWIRLSRSAVPKQKFFPAPVIKTRHRLPEDAVLIVSSKSSEVFFPRTGKGCIVPSFQFPRMVFDTSLNTIREKTILCGGEENNLAECYELTSVGWEK